MGYCPPQRITEGQKVNNTKCRKTQNIQKEKTASLQRIETRSAEQNISLVNGTF